MLNEAMYSLYHQTQTTVLQQVVAVSKDLIARKANKEQQLKSLVEEANDEEKEAQ